MTLEILPRVWRAMAHVYRNRRGNIAGMTAIMLVPLVGGLSVGTEAASWFVINRAMQSAADSAAVAAAENNGAGYDAEAKAVAAKYGFVDGVNNTTVAVDNPATISGLPACKNCYRVVITKNMPLLFSRIVGYSGNVAMGSGRGQSIQTGAIANSFGSGSICIAALDNRAGDIHSIFGGTNANVTIGGNCQVGDNLRTNSLTDSVDVKSGATLNFDSLTMVDASKCDTGSCQGTLNVTKPILYNQNATVDPYAGRTVPAPKAICDHTNLVVSTTTTLQPGTYCGTGGNAALTVSAPSVSLTTNTNPPAGGTTVLTLTASPASVSVGMTASDTTHTTAIPSGTTVTAVNVAAKTVTLSQTALGGASGVHNNDVINFTSSITVTLNPGSAVAPVYILDGQGGGSCTSAPKPLTCLSGDLIISGNATVTGSGVTIVLTTSITTGSHIPIDIGNVYITNGANLSLTAPTTYSGPEQVQGIALWQDPRAANPTATDGNHYSLSPISDGVNVIASGGSTDITGVVYFPSQGLLYSGGSGGTACTQILAFSIVFIGSAQWNFPSDCTSASGELTIGSGAQLLD